MRLFLSFITFIWITLIISVGFSLWVGDTLHSPLLEWSSSTLFLRDIRTGVNYHLQIPNRPPSNTATSVSGLQYVPSPNNLYDLIIFSTNDGLDFAVTDDAGRVIASRESDPSSRFTNIAWANDTVLVVVRTLSSAEGNLSFSLLNVETDEERALGTYRNIFYLLSPDGNWLLMSPRTAGEAEIINIWDQRRYDINHIATAFGWTRNGDYLASRTLITGNSAMQIVDTDTGDIFVDDFAPTRLLWSNNNHDLLVHEAHTMRLYQGTTNVLEHTFLDIIHGAGWSPNGQLAVIVVIRVADYDVYLINRQAEEAVQHLRRLPYRTSINTLQWTNESNGFTYIEYDSKNSDVTYIYHISGENGDTSLVATIPEHVRQVRYIEELANYRSLQ